MRSSLLAVLAGFLFSCTVLGKYPSRRRQVILHPDFYEDTTVCRTTPGLTKAQLEICYRQPNTVSVALQGLALAVKECQHQFHSHRWNCSALSNRTKNPYASAIFQKGFRETAFAYAISTAGVVISIARACSQGSLNCGCDTHKYKIRNGRSNENSVWKKLGCMDDLKYGMKFSRLFLDAREQGQDIQSEINLHNNNVGRMAVASNMQMKCKCHGVSGSCEMKTCWRSVPDFRVVGKTLKEKFKTAILVDQSNLANRHLQSINKTYQNKKKKRLRLKQWTPHKQKHKRALKKHLLYYEKSPNFCDRDDALEIPGTTGRFCSRSNNRTSSDYGNCSTLCCGRGYNLIKQRRTEHCKCMFIWCCSVACQNCTSEEWISICK